MFVELLFRDLYGTSSTCCQQQTLIRQMIDQGGEKINRKKKISLTAGPGGPGGPGRPISP